MGKRIFLLLSYILVAGRPSLVVSKEERKLSPPVQKLCDDYFNWRIADKPQFATYVGIHDDDDKLDDLSDEAFEGTYNTSLMFLNRVKAIEPTLTQEEDLLNIKVLKSELMVYIDGFPFKGYYIPVAYNEGPHVEYPFIFSWMKKETIEDYEKMLNRLSKIPRQMDQMIDLMKKGVKEGLTCHKIAMKSMDSYFKDFTAADGRESALYTYFNDSVPADFNSSIISHIQTKALQILESNVAPAFQKMLDYILKSYVTRPKIRVTSLPNGEAFYDQLIMYHTSTNHTPKEIHNMGLQEVHDIEKEMAEVIKEMDYNMSVVEFSTMLRDDPRSYFNTSEELLARFTYIVEDIIEPKINSLFNYFPKAKLDIVGDPNPHGIAALYYGAPLDGSRLGEYVVNTHNIDAQPNFTMISLSLHEANPGHHLQNSYILETPSVPNFRRVTDVRSFTQPPSLFPIYNAYSEGWALYSESLGKDMKLYENPLDRYGHYSEEIFRACRLVVDTGIHAFGWTKKDAVDYMLLHTALTEGDIKGEVDRYITWPGQALGYKIGEFRIQAMRKKAENELGDLFDIKDFHDVILSTYGTLDIAEHEVQKWIQDVLSQKN